MIKKTGGIDFEKDQIQINVKLIGKHTHSIELALDANTSKQNSSQPTEIVNVEESDKVTETINVQELDKDNNKYQPETSNFNKLCGKERIRVVKEIIEKFNGDCDKYRKVKQGETGTTFYSLAVLSKAKSEFIINKGNNNWVDALTTSASTLQASIRGGKLSGKALFLIIIE